MPVEGAKLSAEEASLLGYHAEASLPVVEGHQRDHIHAQGKTTTELAREVYTLSVKHSQTGFPSFKDSGELRRTDAGLLVILNVPLTELELGEVMKGYRVAEQDASKF